MRTAAALVAVTLAAGVAHADTPDYFAKPNEGSTIKVKRTKSRTTNQRLLIGGLLAGAALGIGVGVYYHLDSRDAANAVSANDDLTGETWTPELQATYDRAGTSGTIAIVGYAIGAAFLGGTIVAAWKTQPGEEQLAVTPRRVSVAWGRSW